VASYLLRVTIAIVVLIAWTIGLFVTGPEGYAKHYLWGSLSMLAIGCAVAPFWSRRSAIWYWPTTLFLITTHVIALYFLSDLIASVKVPPKHIALGIMLADCFACWGLMIGFAYRIEGKFPLD